MRFPVLALFVVATQLAAQDAPEWNDLLHERARAGEELIALRYRRDGHGRLEVASCEGGEIPFGPMFPEDVVPRPTRLRNVALATVLWLTQGEAGVLACTDPERHLRRAGIDPAPVLLRQFLLTPIAAGDAALARVETLDRIVAIDALVRGGHRGVVAELTALARSEGTPPLLKAHATEVMGKLGKQPAANARRRLDPATLLLPPTADAYVVIDHARLPDAVALRTLARRLAVNASHRVVELLRAPTPDDLFHGQFVADLVGELPFEVVRRFGELRLDHSVVAIQGLANDTQPLAWNLQAAGELECAQLTAAAEQIARDPKAKVQCERREGTVHVATPLGDFDFGPASLVGHSKGMAGRSRPELAAELLAEGPAVRVLVPPQSKLWLALAYLQLPPAGRAELCVTFGDEFRACLTIVARDEDAAEKWVARGKQLLASAREELDAIAASAKAPAEDHKPLYDALAATKITADGARVEAVLQSRTLGAKALFALGTAVLRMPL